MELKKRIKNRRAKRYIVYLLKIFRLRSLNLRTSWKIILFWIFFNFISLFFPWVDSIDNSLMYSSFSNISGSIWIIIFIILFLLIFNLFSINSKEKLQLHTSIHFRDYPITFISGFFIFLLSILSLNFINALQTFSSVIIHGSWIILSITSSIIILLWWIIQRVEFKKYSIMSNIYDTCNDKEVNCSEDKKNMKLPF